MSTLWPPLHPWGLYFDPKATSSQSKSSVAFGGIGPVKVEMQDDQQANREGSQLEKNGAKCEDYRWIPA